MKTKLKQAKNQALLDIKKQGLHYSEKEDYAFKPDIPLNHIVDTVIIKVRGEPKIVLTIVR